MDTLPRDVVSVSKSEIEPFKQGRRVGCYLLGKTLGEGSFAKVKEGFHIITGEKVAVKVIDKKRAREDRYISKNLRREARIHQLVRHPNIIQLYEVLETDNFYYLVMEYCAGGELLDYICTRKRLDEPLAKRIVAQLVSAVDGMHNSGVVHRDLKIENFLLNEEEDLKIIDFGLSNTLSREAMQEYDHTGVFPQLLNTHCGSPAYAAPELLAQKKYGPQVDVWSIGINMYAMLTGFLPYMMEPFNVIEMYEKMMQRRMTPIPGFLSKPCRDLLMRLLEPVAEWRITLKQVMKHKWFTGSDHVPRSIPLGDMMYQKKELCESVLSYMKYTLKIRTKDTINAVVSNRAVHASAVYHLLMARLDRYLQERKENADANNKQFAKVEVIKKSHLSTDKTNANASRNKGFIYRGKKIDPNSQSHQNLGDSDHEDDGSNLHNQHLDIPNNNNHSVRDAPGKKDYKKLKDEHASSSETTLSPPSSQKSSNKQKESPTSQNQVQARTKGHRRAISSVNPNELRQAEEIHNKLRNSLCCGSKEDLSKTNENTQERSPGSESPEDPFGKTDQAIVTRKKSVDVKLNTVLGSPSNDEKHIDVIKLLPESPRKSSNEKKKMKRKESIDYQINSESNVKEQKQPIPGWLITKIVKQPPLKEETLNIIGVEHQSAEQCTNTENQTVLSSHESKDSKEKFDNKQLDADVNNNNVTNNDDVTNQEIEKKSSVAEPVCNSPEATTENRDEQRDDDSEVSDAVVEELITSVRNITRNFPEDVVDGFRKVDITSNVIHSSLPQSSSDVKPDLSNSNITRAKIKTTNSEVLDENNNSNSNTDKKPCKSYASKAYRNNSIRGRILALENYEQKLRNRKTDNNVSPIKKITISKKAFELNVKQFKQFKGDKNETHNHSNDHHNNKLHSNNNNDVISPMTPLKPLELKFDFQIRKKKAYKEKQQTRSLTDITKSILGKVDTKPTEEQMLTPKHRCVDKDCTQTHNHNNHANDEEGDEKEPSSVVFRESTEMINTVESQKKATIKITSNKNNTNKKTTIFLSSKRTVPSSNPPVDETSLDMTPSMRITTNKEQAYNSNTSSFDSEDFDEQSHLRSDIGIEKMPPKEKTIDQIEVHSATYRCIPVYQLEYTKTGTVYAKEDLAVISEERKSRQREDGRIHKKWGSQTIEPTQDKADYIPRSAEIINNIKDKLQKVREKKMELLNSANKAKSGAVAAAAAAATRRESTRSRSVGYPPEFENEQTQSSREKHSTELPKQTSRPSPRVYRRATYGYINKTRTVPIINSAPTNYERNTEREKIIAFTHALENAAWRKRSVLSVTN